MELAARIRRVRRALRRRERLAVTAYLGVLTAALALTCTPALRDPVLDKVDWLTRASGARWTLRLEDALEALEAAESVADPVRREERLDRATARLEALDRAFPAPTVEFKRDRERVRLLRALVRAHRAAGREGRALDAARRLVAFDPRRYASHLLHAETALVQNEPEEAAAAYEAVLAIHPNHLPSVGTLVALRAERGDWRGATRRFEAYLEAHWLEPVEIRLAGAPVARRLVPVDGAWHALDVPLSPPRPAPPDALPTAAAPGAAGLAVEVEAARLVPALRAGALPDAERPPGDEDAPAARAVLRVRLRKPVDEALWEAVRRSYRNQLAFERLAEVRERVRVLDAAGEAP